jgi:hypothetical protein
MDDRAGIEPASALLCRQPHCQPAPYRNGRPRGFAPVASAFGAYRSTDERRANKNWSAWLDSNQRSPTSKDGGDGHAPLHTDWCSRQESNPHLRFRRPSSYPFDYESLSGAVSRIRTGVFPDENRASLGR